jgi:hypothetical protein
MSRLGAPPRPIALATAAPKPEAEERFPAPVTSLTTCFLLTNVRLAGGLSWQGRDTGLRAEHQSEGEGPVTKASLVAAFAASMAAVPASAAVTINAGGSTTTLNVGDSTTLSFIGMHDGVNLNGLSNTLQLTLSSQTATKSVFSFTLANNSTAPILTPRQRGPVRHDFLEAAGWFFKTRPPGSDRLAVGRPAGAPCRLSCPGARPPSAPTRMPPAFSRRRHPCASDWR